MDLPYFILLLNKMYEFFMIRCFHLNYPHLRIRLEVEDSYEHRSIPRLIE